MLCVDAVFSQERVSIFSQNRVLFIGHHFPILRLQVASSLIFIVFKILVDILALGSQTALWFAVSCATRLHGRRHHSPCCLFIIIMVLNCLRSSSLGIALNGVIVWSSWSGPVDHTSTAIDIVLGLDIWQRIPVSHSCVAFHYSLWSTSLAHQIVFLEIAKVCSIGLVHHICWRQWLFVAHGARYQWASYAIWILSGLGPGVLGHTLFCIVCPRPMRCSNRLILAVWSSLVLWDWSLSSMRRLNCPGFQRGRLHLW